MTTITFDFTGSAPSGTSMNFVQDGLSLTVSTALYNGAFGQDLSVWEYSTPTLTMNSDGIGALNPYADLEPGFDADGKYEIATFAFGQSVRITSVTLTPLGTRFNTSGANTQFLLFEQGLVANPGSRQTIDTTDNTNEISLYGDFVGIAAYNRFDQWRLASITVELVGLMANPDSYNFGSGISEVPLNVMANDLDAQSITGIDTTGLLGTVTIAPDGLSLIYNAGEAFAALGAGQTATETFTYTVMGYDGSTQTETVTLTITGEGTDITATDNPDTLNATASADIIRGLRGRDTINGNGGNDAIYGGADNDSIRGNAGNDLIYGEDGNDILNGDEGNDTIYGGGGYDTVQGGSGNDLIYLDAGTDLVNGGNGNDTVWGGNDNDRISGNAGLDFLYGEQGADQIWGGADADWIDGGTENDRLYGEDGNDTILGGDGADQIWGGNDNDSIEGGTGNDVLYGDAGNDTVLGGDGNDRLYGGDGNDLLSDTSGTDQFYGDAGNDTLIGGAAANRLDGGTGVDEMRGGAGNDTYWVDDSLDLVFEFAAEGTDLVYATASYTLGAHVDNLTLTGTADLAGTGNELANRLTGNDGNNLLSGLAGADRLDGGLGNDTLDGGLGRDNLTGGAGADAFRFAEWGATNSDTINDFVDGQDMIQFAGSAFGLAAGALDASAFGLGAMATNAMQRIMYDAVRGDIWFDADGNGSGVRQLVASMQDGLVLGIEDFLVV